jgi:hypothetical protein
MLGAYLCSLQSSHSHNLHLRMQTQQNMYIQPGVAVVPASLDPDKPQKTQSVSLEYKCLFPVSTDDILCRQRWTNPLSQASYQVCFICHAITQAVSRWLSTAATQVCARIRSCGICGGQSVAGAGFLRILRFTLPIIPHS